MSNPRPFTRAELLRDGILAEFSGELLERGFGELVDEKIWLFPEEALFLLENGKIKIFKGGKEINREEFLKEMEKRRAGFFFEVSGLQGSQETWICGEGGSKVRNGLSFVREGR